MIELVSYFPHMLHRHHGKRQVYFRIRDLARQMRKHATPAEESFWATVRNRQFLGLKINRQFILECVVYHEQYKFYIADFYCHELKLIIELDGHIHLKQADKDMVRTEHLENHGYRVIRFSNEEVLQNWKSVILQMQKVVAEQAKKHLF